jgi:predicted AlkP superfamily phosphohydrolase/phosphomutase/tetratricopeptide (TPR) repeat protein
MSTRVLLIGWDAADWKVIHPLLENNRMPVLAGFLEQGVMADIRTLEPVLSPMLWNSIGTGKRADQHGILGFIEVDPHHGGVRPVTSTSRKVKAIWNILCQNGYRTHVINWFGGHPAEPVRGVCVSDAYARDFVPPGAPWPLMPGTVHPASLAPALEQLRLRPEHIDAELLQLFVPRAAEVDQKKDHRLEAIARLLAEGFSVHAAATWAMEHEPWDFMAVYYPSIDHFSHGFMHLHPPKLDWVEQHQFDLYRDVVAAAYRLHDLMLGRLLQLAGPDTHVILVSDHGFHSDHLRPRAIPDVPAGPAIQHRSLGIFCMRGPGIRSDERIYGVNLLDVAPTILTLFDLPAGDDMEGRVLAEAFQDLPRLHRIPSWEAVPGESGMHAPGFVMAPEDAQALLRQFVALGYVEAPVEDFEKAREACERERQWNLARVYLSSGRFAAALPILEELQEQVPERGDFGLSLAHCQGVLGMLEEAAATARAAIANHLDTPAARLVLGNVEFARGQYQACLEHLLEAEKADPRLPELYLRIGAAYLKLRRWKSAERAFQHALAIDPHSALAYQGLALTRLRQKRNEEAAVAALTAVGIQHDLPLAHFWLGVALARLGRIRRAIQAFETTLSFHPPVLAAHRWLVRLYLQVPGSAAQMAAHMQAARQARRSREQSLPRLEAIQREARERAAARATSRANRPAATPLNQPDPTDSAPPASLEFTIVSGLPRSGTSLMMHMLSAAGLPVMTDAARTPDPDNPEGYYEWEEMKKVARRPEILRQAEGKVMKVVSLLLPALPRCHRYKVIFMNRPIEEVVASQRKMIDHRGVEEPGLDPQKMTQVLEQHRNTILHRLQATPTFEVFLVDYPDLVLHPQQWVPRIVEFLGHVPHPEAMAGVVRPELHRNRAAPAGNAVLQ